MTSSSSWSKQPLQHKDYLLLSIILLAIAFLPFLGVLSFSVYTLAVLITRFLPYGKFINYFDAWMEEDFTSVIPRNTVVTTLILDNDITLENLRSLFEKNVLEARSTIYQERIRYPELKQYLATFMGFRIWKNDNNFQIENHIIERTAACHNRNGDFLSGIHRELLNLTFEKQRSPWEIILIRNVTGDLLDIDQDNNNDSSPKTLLACRLHHVLADGKSIVKLLVEGLGQKRLKTANSHNIRAGWLSNFIFFFCFPFNFLRIICHLTCILSKSHYHPWKVQTYWKDSKIKTLVAFSPKLKMADLKLVAKKNGVVGSAVIMSSVAGAVRKIDDCLGDQNVAIGYPLPKPNHPETLTNHMYLGFFNLPTSECNVSNRLQQCNLAFQQVKSNQQGRHIELAGILAGSQLFPMTRLAVNHFTPTGITNIAGEEEGFSVGKGQCIDFRMTVGTLGGVAGVVFCSFSYMDGIRIAVTAKENILSQEKAEKLALYVHNEFKLLQNI